MYDAAFQKNLDTDGHIHVERWSASNLIIHLRTNLMHFMLFGVAMPMHVSVIRIVITSWIEVLLSSFKGPKPPLVIFNTILTKALIPHF